jgi:uncharacterized membrane protein
MLEFPPIPAWAGFHPLVVHLPIALLLISPLFIGMALIVPKMRRCFLVAALVLMLIGTVSAWVAVASGEAAGELAERSPEINAVLMHHEELAETTRTVFTVLTAVFSVFLIVLAVRGREKKGWWPLAFLLLFVTVYLVGTVILANTAHNGGRLVHEFGVRSIILVSPLPGQ